MNDAKENPVYEARDASTPQVVTGAAVLFALIGFSLIVAAFVYRSDSILPIRNDAKTSFTHGSENESTIVRDWREQDKLVRDHLESYGWVDRKNGLVRIPIERAMELMARDAENPARKNHEASIDFH